MGGRLGLRRRLQARGAGAAEARPNLPAHAGRRLRHPMVVLCPGRPPGVDGDGRPVRPGLRPAAALRPQSAGLACGLAAGSRDQRCVGRRALLRARRGRGAGGAGGRRLGALAAGRADAARAGDLRRHHLGLQAGRAARAADRSFILLRQWRHQYRLGAGAVACARLAS